MTEREEQAVVVLNTLQDNPLLSDIHRQALEVGIMAIKALSSSEKPNKWISADVLDKIRAEIAAIAINGQVDEHTMFIRSGEQVKQMSLAVIDKYKAESEVQE